MLLLIRIAFKLTLSQRKAPPQNLLNTAIHPGTAANDRN